ncbi:amidohydrolase family protein [Thalassobaculum sp.]|uniref:amidohydrolase family protein n=1 Tax=Thalassobaculum sp. TaxID=2022740 RepID=UPI003B5AF9E3
MPILIRARWVFVQDASDPAPRRLDDAAVLVRHGVIVEIAPAADLCARYPDAPTFGDGTQALLPGLINAHHHSNAITHIQHGIEDGVLEPWILGNPRMRWTNPRLRTLVAAGRLLQTGVTAVVDMASVGNAYASGHDDLAARLDAYEESGIRGHLAGGVSFYSRLVHREDEAFVAQLPGDLARRVRAHFLDADKGSERDYLALMDSLIDRAKDMKRARAWYGPPGPQWVGDDLMVAIADGAERHDTGIQTHVQESLYERLEAERALGKSMTAHLKDLGVLSPRISFAHAVWSSQRDVEILSETGAAISHNPSSNLRLRSGVAPLNGFIAGGVTTGLGMDGTTIGDDEDMFAEIRLAHRLHRTPRIGAPAPTLEQSFGLVTTGGAKLLRREDELGRIAPGMIADLVLVNVERLSWPYVAPEADPFAVVLQRAKQGDVDTVIVGGEVVLQDGWPTRFDLKAVAAELAEQVAALPYDRDYADLYAELRPHVEAWYAAWEVPEMDPWIAHNSRT